MVSKTNNYLQNELIFRNQEIYRNKEHEGLFPVSENSREIRPVFIQIHELKEYAGDDFEKMYDLTKYPYCLKHPELHDGEIYFGNFPYLAMVNSIFRSYRYGNVCYDTSGNIIK